MAMRVWLTAHAVGLADKVMDRLKSSRVWATTGGNIIGIQYVHSDWPRAAVVIAVNGLYVLSEVVLYWRGVHS